MANDMIRVAGLPAPGGKLTREQWQSVEAYLEQWKSEVMAAVRQHPARSFEAGKAQVEAFVNLLTNLGQVSLPPGGASAEGPTAREAQWWTERYTFHEIDDALNAYIGKIKDAILHGLKGSMNPTTVASALYKATRDSQVNWRAIARTEMVRATAAGRYRAMLDMGFDKCWFPPHAGACKSCRFILENKVFSIAELVDASNYGRPQHEWVACCPLHPHCRHVPLPYVAEVYDAAVEHYRKMEEAGFTDDDRLDAMFDSSGQLNPEYTSTDFSMFKTRGDLTAHVDGLYHQGLMAAVAKVRSERLVAKISKRWPRLELGELRSDLYQRDPDPAVVDAFAELYRTTGEDAFSPPVVSRRSDGTDWLLDGQHRVLGAQKAGKTTLGCDVRRGLSLEEEMRICREAMGEEHPRPAGFLAKAIEANAPAIAATIADVAKGFFDPPQAGRDPALWEDESDQLRSDVHQRLTRWAAHVLGEDFAKWAALYLTGGATSRQWLSHPERDSDVDLQIVVNYAKLRKRRPEWADFSDGDLHFALTALVKAGLEDADDVVPGIRLDAFLRPEQTISEFERDAGRSRQAVWSVLGHRWITQGLPDAEVELYGDPWLEGIGAQVATAHPDWVADAHFLVQNLDQALRQYGDNPTRQNLRYLREAYEIVHNMRADGYANPDDPMSPAQDGLGELSRGNFMWQFAVNYGPLMHIKHLLQDASLGKVFPNYAYSFVESGVAKMAPDTGVEHWITVHPNGDEGKGQPVLVRNNSDGSMSVIGGAGGSLNYLRLDRKRRISPKGEQAGADEKARMKADQPISDEERQRQEAEFEARSAEARKTIEHVEGQKQAIRDELHEYVTGTVGYDIFHKEVKHADGRVEVVETSKTEQRKLLQQLGKGALHTLTYGERSRKDANESPYLLSEKHGDFEDLKDGEGDASPEDPDAPKDEEATPDEQLQKARSSLPRTPPMSAEQAQTIMELNRKIARLGKVQSSARKLLRDGGAHSDSLALNWSDADIKKDVSKRVSEEKRTDVARSLLETAESNRNKSALNRAVQQGAYDTIDAFTHAVLGVSAIPPEAARLLGVAGSAQLAAYGIRQYAAKEGVELDTQKALDALQTLTDRHEKETAQRALARARAAADTAVQMREERKASEAGDSLWTTTMARSYEVTKMNEAARLLGMGISGFEAASALKVAMARPSDEIKVGGFESAGQIKALAAKAGIEVKTADISRVGAGDYSLTIPADRMQGLFQFEKPPNTALRDRLKKIRTGKGLDREIEAARQTPGMVDELAPSQAQGKMFLQATAGAGHGAVLDFAPGVGKTHTGIAAALAQDAAAGIPQGQSNTWIVCPVTAMSEWAGTIAKNTGRSCQMIGKEFTHLGGGKIESRGKGGKHRDAQLASPADFNVISFEQLKSLLKTNPELHKQINARRVITDEAQKAKNEKSETWDALEKLGHATHERWALSGTVVEKKVKDLGSLMRWTKAGAGASLTPNQMEEKYGKLGQDEHITGADKVRQFREGLDEGLFKLSASDAGNDLPTSSEDEHQVTLDPEHMDALHGAVESINRIRAEAAEKGGKGLPFGGRQVLQQALYNRPGNAMARSVADEVEKSLDEPVEFEGLHGEKGHEDGEAAGTYEPKHIVFSQFVKQLDHVVDELKGRGHTVFYAHGGMSSEENDEQLKQFLAHPKGAVLVTSDKNSTARSLQFGLNKGEFQYGATHHHDYSLPDNNATIQQRRARILRRGSQVPVKYHTYSANTPAEMRQQDRLEGERRTQSLAGNSEQLVGGKETLRHLLDKAGQPAAAAQL